MSRGRIAGLPAVGLACAVAILLAAHLMLLLPPTVSLSGAYDEGYIQAFAVRMLDGQMLPYVDGVSHRGPVLYWVAALAIKAGGDPFSFLALRLLICAVSISCVLLVFAAAALVRGAAFGAIAALCYSFFLLYVKFADGIQLNGEPVQDLFLLLALVCLAKTLRPGQDRVSLLLCGLAGLCTSLAVLTRQTAAVTAVPFVLWIVAVSWQRLSARRLRPLLVFAIAGAVPVILVVIRYAAAGELDTFIYYFFTYNSTVYLEPLGPTAPLQYLAWVASTLPVALPYLALTGFLLYQLTRDNPRGRWPSWMEQHGFLVVAALGALAAGFASNLTVRGFNHYNVPILPWISFVVTYAFISGFDYLFAPLSRRRTALFLGAPVLLSLAAFVYLQCVSIRSFRVRSTPICDFVQDQSRPRDTIFVWGFDASLYTLCKRKPATRYVFTTFPAGIVPWFDEETPADEALRVVPGSRLIMMRELEASRPQIVIDAGTKFMNHPVSFVPELQAFLQKSYQPPLEWAGYNVYVRKDP